MLRQCDIAEHCECHMEVLWDTVLQYRASYTVIRVASAVTAHYAIRSLTRL